MVYAAPKGSTLTEAKTEAAVETGLRKTARTSGVIISRHREQLADPDMDAEESIARAVATAGSAVVFADATVIVALAALSATGIPCLAVMGLSAAATVLIAVLIAVSLVPAVLGLFGWQLRPKPRHPRAGHRERVPGAWGLAWARAVTRRPLIVLLVGVIALLTLALPARNLRLGLPSYVSDPTASTRHKSYDLLTKGFGPGFNATLVAVGETKGIPAGDITATATDLRTSLPKDSDVATVSQPVPNPAKSLLVMAVVPKTGPDDQATTDMVSRLRDNASAGGTSTSPARPQRPSTSRTSFPAPCPASWRSS
ncbi:MMPL family transporter [Streptomyces sp. S1D4-11]|nr:MMPL family transporter [Streptomyces sp. S1D4-11]